MIEIDELQEICKKYNINSKILIDNNNNILKYGEYKKICDILEYLKNIVGIAPKNIEKCPSIRRTINHGNYRICKCLF